MSQTIDFSLENGDVLRLLPSLFQDLNGSEVSVHLTYCPSILSKDDSTYQPSPHHLLHLVLGVIARLIFTAPNAHDLFSLRYRHLMAQRLVHPRTNMIPSRLHTFSLCAYRQILNIFCELVVLKLLLADLLVRSE